MGFFDSFSELVAAAMPWETVEAEAPEEKEEKDEVWFFLYFCRLDIEMLRWVCVREE
jgi:hypothetical protein